MLEVEMQEGGYVIRKCLVSFLDSISAASLLALVMPICMAVMSMLIVL